MFRCPYNSSLLSRYCSAATSPPAFEKKELSNLTLLGTGAFGKVFKAQYKGESVVYKTPESIRPNEHIASLFRKEALLLYAVRGHENVANLVAFDSVRTSLLMQFYMYSFEKVGVDMPDVHSMRDFMATLDQLDEITKLQHMVTVLISDIASGLGFLHSQNIVHRDIKPDNVLVSNQHYLGCDADVLPMWLAIKPIVAVLTDFGESRSDLLRTNAACATFTTNLFRGSPAFMAPESLRNTGHAAMADLQSADVWSFAMILFCALNPSSSYPYQAELLAAPKTDNGLLDDLRRLHSTKALPVQDARYNALRNASWAPLVRLYDACAIYASCERPTMDSAQRLLICHSVRIDSLVLSQSTASEEWSRQVIAGCPLESPGIATNNACTYFALLIGDKVFAAETCDFSVIEIANACLLSFPAIPHRTDDSFESLGDAYDKLHAVGAVAKLSFNYLVCSTGDVSLSVAKQELCSALYNYFTVDAECGFFTAKCVIYILVPYTFLICRNGDGNVCVVDTHAVPPSSGGENNGVVVTACDRQRCFSDIASWLFNRVRARNVVHHELACITSRDATPQMRGDAINVDTAEGTVSSLVIIESSPADNLCEERYWQDTKRSCALSGPSDIAGPETNDVVGEEEMTSGNGTAARELLGVHDLDIAMKEEQAARSMSERRSWGSAARNGVRCDGGAISDKSRLSFEAHSKAYSARQYYNVDNWSDCEAQQVQNLPHAIDGWCKFVMRASSSANMMVVARDGRPWMRWVCSSRAGFSGVRRTTRCSGSFYCPSTSCSFLAQHSYANNKQFVKRAGVTVCFTCSVAGVRRDCSAVKIWEFEEGTGIVTVYHNGEHTCFAKRFCHSSTRKALKDAIRAHPNLAPSRIVDAEMMAVMSHDDFDWGEVTKIASDFGNLKQIQNIKSAVKRDNNPIGENFEALGVYREKCNELDPFLIYKVNNRSLNGEPSFVFKSSKSMAEMAISIDRDNKQHPLADEYAHVDVTHSRCRNFQTVTLWVYQPVMRKLMRLGVMDIERENAVNLTLFWNTFNAMLQQCSGDDTYVFNPKGFVADEHHANWQSINNVFGKEVLERVISCEFHYKQTVQRHARSLSCEDSREEFITLAELMLSSQSQSKFNEAVESMSKFTVKHESVGAWFKWWYDRRTHIFRCFKPVDSPCSNLAEVGHAKLASGGHPYMSLLDAAKHDVTGAIRQQEECKLFDEGVGTGGAGVNCAEKRSRQHKRALKQAAEYGAELVQKQAKKFVPLSGIDRPLSCKSRKKAPKAPSAPRSAHIVPQTQAIDPPQTSATASAVPSVKETFHVVQLSKHPAVQKCYGCEAPIKAPGHDVILQFFCNRRFKNKEKALCVASKKSACYFHLNVDCVRKTVPRMEVRDVVLHDETRPLLTREQVSKLQKFGVE